MMREWAAYGLDEPGTSLKAAGWIEDGLTADGEYDRPSRPRQKQIDSAPKRRWWAPGSKKAPKRAIEPKRSGSAGRDRNACVSHLSAMLGEEP